MPSTNAKPSSRSPNQRDAAMSIGRKLTDSQTTPAPRDVQTGRGTAQDSLSPADSAHNCQTVQLNASSDPFKNGRLPSAVPISAVLSANKTWLVEGKTTRLEDGKTTMQEDGKAMRLEDSKMNSKTWPDSSEDDDDDVKIAVLQDVQDISDNDCKSSLPVSL